MKTRFTIALTAVLLGSHTRVWACATCFGAQDDPQTQGMNAAILTLLGVTYGLFAAMIAAGFVLWRKSLAVTQGLDSPDAGFASSRETPHE